MRMQLAPKYAAIIFSLSTCCLFSAACGELLKKPPSDAAVAAEARVIDCEWKAADQYDDGRYKTFSEFAQRLVDVCAVELRDARSASGRSPSDQDELNEAIKNIQNARYHRLHPALFPQGDKNPQASAH
jgi:hypothetical protein